MSVAKKLMIATLVTLALAFLVFLWLKNANAAFMPTRSTLIVECVTWPWTGNTLIDADMRQLGKKTGDGRIRATFRLIGTGRRVRMQGRFLGLRSGNRWWAIRGPIRLRQDLLNAGCQVAKLYANASTLAAPKFNWVKARSTCIGEATRNGQTISVWPCGQAGTVEVRIDGLAPRVLYQGSARTAAGM